MSNNHQPKPVHHEEHIENTQQEGVRDAIPYNVLPHTVVPQYLTETPLQEQDRHLDSFHRNQPQANQAGDKLFAGGFSRPSMGDNLDLIRRNLSDDEYFLMRWRAPYGTRGKDGLEVVVTTGDGTPDTVVVGPATFVLGTVPADASVGVESTLIVTVSFDRAVGWAGIIGAHESVVVSGGTGDNENIIVSSGSLDMDADNIQSIIILTLNTSLAENGDTITVTIPAEGVVVDGEGDPFLTEDFSFSFTMAG